MQLGRLKPPRREAAWTDMADKSAGPDRKINTRVPPWMDDAIQQWMRAYDRTESDVVRAALVEGLKALKRDPSPLGRPVVNPDEISPPEGAKPPGERTIAMDAVRPTLNPDGSVTPPPAPWGFRPGGQPPPQEPPKKPRKGR